MTPTNAAPFLQNKTVAVVGGGPGGLMLARLLQLGGATVTVYERDASRDARVQGAIVDLHYDSGLHVMEAAGLLEVFKTRYMPGADKFRMVDKDVKVLLDEHAGGAEADFGDAHFRPEIDRGALRDLLLDALQPGTVVWDRQVLSLEPLGDGWQLRFKNGTTATADLVVGADGFRSRIRPYVTDVTAQYSGATIIQGEVDHPERDCPRMSALVGNANLIAMGAGKTIAAQPRGDGGLTFYASSLYPEGWVATSGIDFNDKTAVQAHLEQQYADWDPVFQSLFNACTHFVPRPLNYFPPDQHWEPRTNITLLGDAAHLMPPSGEGVNTAMLDALDLSVCLSGAYETVRAALTAYEEKMLARAAVLTEEALTGIIDFASPSAESVDKLVRQLSGSES